MSLIFAAFGRLESIDRDGVEGEQNGPQVAHFARALDSADHIRLVAWGSGGGRPCLGHIDSHVTVVVAGHVEGSVDASAALGETYRDGGPAAVSGLRGEYAFALWDGRSRSLLAGCDAIGVRAPAYSWDGRAFRLASRAIQLLSTRTDRRQPIWDPVYLAHGLAGSGARTTSATAYGGVQRMLAGEILRASAHGLERLPGDRLQFEPLVRRHRRDAVVELERRLDRVVAERASGARVCVALSGGLDSCVV